MSERRYYYRRHTTLTDRVLPIYEGMLGVFIDSLSGKTVLDIGSGKHLTFARQARERGVNVISLNPELQVPRQRRRINPLRKRILRVPDKDRPPAIAAIAQQLPLADESVDAVFSLWAVPYWLPKEAKQVEAFFAESMRVLKPGGIASFYPIGGKNQSDKMCEAVMLGLAKGYMYEIFPKYIPGYYNLLLKK